MSNPHELNFWSGDEACAEGAIAAGCRFFAGYPICPASEIAQRLSVRLPQAGGTFLQMEDEIASICAAAGASWAGAKAMTATSGPGFSLMLEGLGYAVMTETPLVVVDVQRAGPSTGQATKPAQGDIQQARWGAHGDYQIIALSPWSPQEMYELTIEAFNLSEKFRTPVVILADEIIGHTSEVVSTKKAIPVVNRSEKSPSGRRCPPCGEMFQKKLGAGQSLLVTGSTHDEEGYRRSTDPAAQAKLLEHLQNKILAGMKQIVKLDAQMTDDAQILLVSYGASARACIAAMKLARQSGYKAGLLRLVSLWPFADDEIRTITKNAKRIIVAEMNKGQIAREVERCAKRDVISLSKTDGELITPEEVLNKIKSSA